MVGAVLVAKLSLCRLAAARNFRHPLDLHYPFAASECPAPLRGMVALTGSPRRASGMDASRQSTGDASRAVAARRVAVRSKWSLTWQERS